MKDNLEVRQDSIAEMVQEVGVCWRNGARSLLSLTSDWKIPVLIISAGFGEIVKEILKVHRFLSPSMTLIGNFFNWNQNGIMEDATSPYVTSMTKDTPEILPIDLSSKLIGRSSKITNEL